MKYILFFLSFTTLLNAQTFVGVGANGDRMELVLGTNVTSGAYTGRIVYAELSGSRISNALKAPYRSPATTNGTQFIFSNIALPTPPAFTISNITSTTAQLNIPATTPAGWETCSVRSQHAVNPPGTANVFTTSATVPIFLTGLVANTTYSCRYRFAHIPSGVTSALTANTPFTTPL